LHRLHGYRLKPTSRPAPQQSPEILPGHSGRPTRMPRVSTSDDKGFPSAAESVPYCRSIVQGRDTAYRKTHCIEAPHETRRLLPRSKRQCKAMQRDRLGEWMKLNLSSPPTLKS